MLAELLDAMSLPSLGEYVRSTTPVLISVGAVAAATTYYLSSRPKALAPACDLNNQSIEIKGGELARRSAMMPDETFLTHLHEDGRTVYEFFLRGVKLSNNGPCFGARKPNKPYEWISYNKVKERCENLGSAFLQKGHSKTKNPHIGIFSQNRPEWVITELACYTYSLVAVPLYDTLGVEAIGYSIDKASIITIVCESTEKVNLVLDCFQSTKHTLKSIILMEEPNAKLIKRGMTSGIHIASMWEMEELGRANHRPPIPPAPDDMALICFTSGTTGDPKGAMLTHGNIVSNCCSFVKVTEFSCPLDSSDVHISYLPLAHMFERVVQGVMFMYGASIGFFQGDIRLLTDDLATLKPTVFPVVPRLLNRMYDKIFLGANTMVKRWILKLAYKRKEAALMNGIVRRDSVWDRLVFRKIQMSMGGRVRLMLTGAAPVSATVLSFLRAAMGCQFYEGYGQTECTAGCSLTMPGDWTAGHVGAPLPCNIIKLVDVPEMNYLAKNGEGEVCVKGANVFKGYLNDAEKTAEAIDKDGWLHTGDIGKWLPNGTLKIVDRKKHIFKLAQGEYIIPEKIENIYTRCDSVAQIFVHGDSLQTHLVGVVVPDPEHLVGWAQKKLKLQGSYEELCSKEKVKSAIMDDLIRIGKEAGLHSFEQVKAIYLHPELFSIENGLLTPTMKSKRNEMQKYFRPVIDKLYASLKDKHSKE